MFSCVFLRYYVKPRVFFIILIDTIKTLIVLHLQSFIRRDKKVNDEKHGHKINFYREDLILLYTAPASLCLIKRGKMVFIYCDPAPLLHEGSKDVL